MSVKNGDKIKVNYTGKFEDGTVFDSSEGKEPLEFTVGEGIVVKGFDAAVLGMEIGETKTSVLKPEEAYGLKSDEMVVEIPREEFGADFTANVGEKLLIQLGDGNEIPVEITEINDKIVKLDANHPLAGKTLVFTVTIVEVN
ncbi:MAG: peptidylprolyl isomerase [Methanocorpusculum sp.]|nr:peptidylprolyl isomerase [Methanocorpusculum sp.]